MRKILVTSVVALVLVGMAPAANAVRRAPETLAGAEAAARAASCSTCVDPGGDADSASRGLVELGVGDGSGIGGAMQLWGYTGTRWSRLSTYQDANTYPTAIPSTIWICTDSNNTNLRSGPSVRNRVIAKVTSDVQADATRFRLSTAQRGDVEGLGWYQVNVDGKSGWVASYRVTSDAGCDVWAEIWASYGKKHANR